MTILEKPRLRGPAKTTPKQPELVSFLQLFREQVNKYPEEVVIVDQFRCMTYSDLDKKSDFLAEYLKINGIRSGEIVGVCSSLNLEFIVVLLGVLKAGGVYFPLDPAHPEDRRQYMVNEAKPSAILVEPIFEHLFKEARLVKIEPKIFECTFSPQNSLKDFVPSPEDLAYLIYTSGSTGNPKGIMVTHGSLPNIALAHRGYYPPKMRMLLSGGVCFDASLLVIFHSLINNSPLYLFDYSLLNNINNLLHFIKRKSINFMISVPSQYLKLLQANEPLPSLKCVSLTGENLTKNLCTLHAKLVPNAILYNEYGPTECAIGTTIAKIFNPQRQTTHRITVGSPLPNTHVYILDSNLNSVPQGSKGEICISGVGLAKGYIGKGKLTSQKFTYILTTEGKRVRIYRTGDIGRFLPNHELEFLGRQEQDVKVLGKSINLGEIEYQISHHPDIQEAAVVIGKNHNGESHLTVYFTSLKKSAQVSLLRYLKSNFGKWLPFSIVPVTRFPFSTNGKIDRNALVACHV